MSKGKIRLVTPGSIGLFDERPIKLPGFELRHNAAVATSAKPTIEEWANAFELASASTESSPYWVGDLLRYADDRVDWREKLDQAKSATKLEEQTLHNYGSICRRVAKPEREIAQSFSHAALVAKLPPAEQRKWLKKSRTEGWGKRDLDMEIKNAQKRGVLNETADLEGMYRVWSVDFPWIYGQAQPSKSSAQGHYPGMTVDEGIAMGDMVKAHTQKNAVAFFWVTAPMLYYASEPDLGPDPYRIIRAWGFEPKTGAVWDKVLHNFGHYVSIRHEHLLICTRGSLTPDRATPMLDSIFSARKSDVHSEKPKEAFDLIERLYDGPYVEIFARDKRKGWTTWGNQINGKVLARATG